MNYDEMVQRVKNLDARLNGEISALSPSREEVWLRAWCAAQQAYPISPQEGLLKRADHCLAEFDKRFGLN